MLREGNTSKYASDFNKEINQNIEQTSSEYSNFPKYRIPHKSGAIGELGYLAKYGKM
jgi:hypothetical protein